MPKMKLVHKHEKPWFRQWQAALDDEDSPAEGEDLPDYALQIYLGFGWSIILY